MKQAILNSLHFFLSLFLSVNIKSILPCDSLVVSLMHRGSRGTLSLVEYLPENLAHFQSKEIMHIFGNQAKTPTQNQTK